MSDPHDHQPDPAALDELQRAFGGGADDAEEPATEQPGDRPAADEDPSGDPDGPLGSPRTGGDAAEPNEVHDEPPPADGEDVADDATDRRREVLSALGIDDDVIDDLDPAVAGRRTR